MTHKCSKETRNPFFNFLRCFRTRPENEHKSAVDIAVRGAREWNKMTDEDRAHFVEMAMKHQKPKKVRASRAKSTTRRRRRTTTRKSRGRRTTRRTTRSRRRTRSRRPVKRRSGRPRKRRSKAEISECKPGSTPTVMPSACQSCQPSACPSCQRPLLMDESPMKMSPETPSPAQECEIRSKVLEECGKPLSEEFTKTDQPVVGDPCSKCGSSSHNVIVGAPRLNHGCSLLSTNIICPCCVQRDSSDSDSSEKRISCKCAEMARKFQQQQQN